MPAVLNWLIEGKVIYQYWWGIGTLDDIHQVNAQTLAMYADHPHQAKIHTISDALDQDIVQSSISDIRRSYTALDHPQTGWVILINNHSMIRVIGNLLMRLSQGQFRMERTYPKALDILSKLDSHIDMSKIDSSVLKRKSSPMTTE